jgi:hypothetical protein
MRSKKIEVEMNNRLKEALEKKKQKDNRGKRLCIISKSK